jgi:hypothetical protein
MKIPEDLKIFVKYIVEEFVSFVKTIASALIGMPKTLWHGINKPKTWFYIVFVLFIYRFVMMRSWNHLTDKLVLAALVIIVLWKEYEDGVWKAKWRESEKKRIIKMVQDQQLEEKNGIRRT